MEDGAHPFKENVGRTWRDAAGPANRLHDVYGKTENRACAQRALAGAQPPDHQGQSSLPEDNRHFIAIRWAGTALGSRSVMNILLLLTPVIGIAIMLATATLTNRDLVPVSNR